MFVGIETGNLMEPILDVGCGKKGLLVKYLSYQGFSIVGIDRFSFTESNLFTADWLEYEYGNNHWGTIISNLGFSNHFIHHNLRDDGNYLAYGKKIYGDFEILKSGRKFLLCACLTVYWMFTSILKNFVCTQKKRQDWIIIPRSLKG